MPMSTLVTGAPLDMSPAPAPQRERVCARVTTRARLPVARCPRTHSGQWNPTGAGIMHS